MRINEKYYYCFNIFGWKPEPLHSVLRQGIGTVNSNIWTRTNIVSSREIAHFHGIEEANLFKLSHPS